MVMVMALVFSSLVPAQAATKKQAPKVTSVHHQAMININTATVKELVKIKGIGEKKAEAIVAFRTKNGNFKKTADIMLVKGIGKKMFERIKDHITVK